MSAFVCGCDPDARRHGNSWPHHCEHYPNCVYGRAELTTDPSQDPERRRAVNADKPYTVYTEYVYPHSTAQEVRVADPVTGGQKGSKLARFSLLPWDALWLVAEHFGKGARKYEDRNWEKGYRWSLSYDALCRHLVAFWHREDFGEEAPLGRFRHIVAVAWHALVLTVFSIRGLGTDDRPQSAVIKEEQ